MTVSSGNITIYSSVVGLLRGRMMICGWHDQFSLLFFWISVSPNLFDVVVSVSYCFWWPADYVCIYLKNRQLCILYIFFREKLDRCGLSEPRACVAIIFFDWNVLIWLTLRPHRPQRPKINCQFRNASFIYSRHIDIGLTDLWVIWLSPK